MKYVIVLSKLLIIAFAEASLMFTHSIQRAQQAVQGKSEITILPHNKIETGRSKKQADK